MKPSVKICCLLSLVILIHTSCSPGYYLSMKQNVKVFEEKGDVVASISAGPLFARIGVDAGYAITDNIGFVSSFNKMNISASGYNNKSFVKDFIWDNEFVYYKNYESGRFWAANIGYGRGGFNVGNPYFRLDMDRIFVQPSYGKKVFKRSYLSLSTRLTQQFYDLTIFTEGYTDAQNKLMQEYLRLDRVDKTNFYIETALTFHTKVDGGNLKYQFINPYKVTDGFLPVFLFVVSYSIHLNKL